VYFAAHPTLPAGEDRASAENPGRAPHSLIVDASSHARSPRRAISKPVHRAFFGRPRNAPEQESRSTKAGPGY